MQNKTAQQEPTEQSSPSFTDQQMARMCKFYDTLRRIHDRLAIEGYFLPDGKTWDIFKVGTPSSEMELDDKN